MKKANNGFGNFDNNTASFKYGRKNNPKGPFADDV